MQFERESADSAAEIAALFEASFTASEGAEEGALIGKLAADLFATTPQEDLYAFTARDEGVLTGCIFFSRLRYPEDDRTVFVLAPVAVATERQGQGIGQGLLRHGLEAMREAGVDVAITYGDPAYYGKVGFQPITETQVRAPFTLQMPQGWLGQSLTDRPLETIQGPALCVEALNAPELW